MPTPRHDGKPHGADPDVRRRILVFALVEAVFMLFVTVPVLLWLFVFANGSSEAELTRYALGIVALQAAFTALLFWKFRIIPGAKVGNTASR